MPNTAEKLSYEDIESEKERLQKKYSRLICEFQSDAVILLVLHAEEGSAQQKEAQERQRKRITEATDEELRAFAYSIEIHNDYEEALRQLRQTREYYRKKLYDLNQKIVPFYN